MQEKATFQAVAAHAYAYPYRMWGFGEGPGLLGMISVADLLGEDRYLRRVEELVMAWLSRTRKREDHVASAEVLLALEQRAGRPGLREAAETWADMVVEAKRTRPGYPGVHRPDLPLWSSEVWVDCLHTDGPGLAALGRTSEAATVVEESAAILQDPCGLFCHGFDMATDRSNGVHWGRGCGWALLGLVGTLAEVPAAGLHSRLTRLLDALELHEDDGRWRTIVDDPTAPQEASVSALVAEGVYAGMRDSVLGEEYRHLAKRALNAALAESRDGALLVSDATPVGEPEDYKRRSDGIFPWGQGPLLLALAAAEGWRPILVQADAREETT